MTSIYLKDYPIRISTMTQVSSLSTSIELRELFEQLPVKSGSPITYAIHGYNERGISHKKRKATEDETVGGKSRKRYFFNQVTVHIQLDKTINMKVFNNGGIQMTGLKSMEQGAAAIEALIAAVHSLSPEVQKKVFLDRDPTCSKSRMVMINSDFDIGFKINRENLHRHIIASKRFSSYNDEVYPGVNIKYYYNVDKQDDGVCNCVGICDGKGHNGACKKITIAVFKSGKIIITGGQTMEHIHTAHEFICGFILARKDDIAMK